MRERTAKYIVSINSIHFDRNSVVLLTSSTTIFVVLMERPFHKSKFSFLPFPIFKLIIKIWIMPSMYWVNFRNWKSTYKYKEFETNLYNFSFPFLRHRTIDRTWDLFLRIFQSSWSPCFFSLKILFLRNLVAVTYVGSPIFCFFYTFGTTVFKKKDIHLT